MGMLLAECISHEIAKEAQLPDLGVWSDGKIYQSGFAVVQLPDAVKTDLAASKNIRRPTAVDSRSLDARIHGAGSCLRSSRCHASTFGPSHRVRTTPSAPLVTHQGEAPPPAWSL